MARARSIDDAMVHIDGGDCLVGSTLAGYPEEGPPHRVHVDGFFIDATPVTVGQFRRFVKETGYVTVAERPLRPEDYPKIDPRLLVPGSVVFQQTSGPVDLSNLNNWWRYVPGASWRQPEGPDSSIEGREHHPVVHVTYEDALSYARYCNKQLPTEAEWEFAARGGLEAAIFTWGDEFMPNGEVLANYWIGEFPYDSKKPPEKRRTSPVGSYPPNGYGLYDMAGNVWEWTCDFWRDSRPVASPCCTIDNPKISDPQGSYDPVEAGGAHVPRRVIKGGSHLCAPNYCLRFRPAARQAQMVESSMSHIGFRCIVRDN